MHVPSIYYVAVAAATTVPRSFVVCVLGIHCGGDIIHLITSAKSCENPKCTVILCLLLIFCTICVCTVCVRWGGGEFFNCSYHLLLYLRPCYTFDVCVCFPRVCRRESENLWHSTVPNDEGKLRFCVGRISRLLYTTTMEIKCPLILSIHYENQRCGLTF